MQKLKFNYFLLLMLFFSILPEVQYGQDNNNAARKIQLGAYRKQATELMNTNKNAPALEVLQRYGQLQEAIIIAERDSIINGLTENFNNGRMQRLQQINSKGATIKTLKSENDDIDAENLKMTRNTLLIFGILIGLAVLILLNRFRTLAGLKEQLELSNSQIKRMDGVINAVKSLDSKASDASKLHQTVDRELQHANGFLSRITGEKQHPMHKNAMTLLTGTKKAIGLFSNEPGLVAGEKVTTDLNALIDEITDQAYYSMLNQSAEFQCTLVRDLEKILPKVDIDPHAIRIVIFSLLTNALETVKEKKSRAPKGYEPKITITTRKLPRFVQVRIKDNGTGITEKDPKKVFEPFYTTKGKDIHTGLGLSESYRIIQVLHKGELLIESDPGQGSDFIVRFPILSLM